MSEVWVDPGRLVDAARVVATLGEGIVAASKPSAVQSDTDLSGSAAALACGVGCRSAAEVVDVVGAGLRRWATAAERAAAEYTRVDAATATRLVAAARALPPTGDGR